MDPVSTSNDAGEGPQTLVFTPNQIACVCNVLMEKGDYERLTKFMLSLPNDKSLYQNEDVVRAQCVALFHINDFKGLYSTLENHSFSSEHHQFLQVSPHLGTILIGPSRPPFLKSEKFGEVGHGPLVGLSIEVELDGLWTTDSHVTWAMYH